MVKEDQEEQRPRLQTLARLGKSLAEKSDIKNDDFDGMSAFFSSFQLTLVLFVLSPTNTNNGKHPISITEQLDDVRSHFHRAQRLSVQHQQGTKAPRTTEMTESDTQKPASNSSVNNAWGNCVLLLPDTKSAIQNLIAIADSVLPERKARKRALFQRLETKYFLPPRSVSKTNTDGKVPSAIARLPGQIATKNQSKTSNAAAAAAAHVAEGLRKIARAFELPNGEEDILMSELRDLKTIATADDSLLATIPIDQRTQKVLHGFFGSLGGRGGADGFRGRHRQPRRELEFGQLQREQLHLDSKNLTSIATQLFPPSTATSSLLTARDSPHSRSPRMCSMHTLRAHQKVPRFQHPQHYEHNVDFGTTDKFWFGPRRELAKNSDVSHAGNNEITDDVFEISAINGTNSYPPVSLPQGSTRADRRINTKQPQGIDFRCSHFSAENPTASSFAGADNVIDTFPTSGSQMFNDDLRLQQENLLPHSQYNPSFEGLYQHQPVQQSSLSQQYTTSHYTNYGDRPIHR